MLRDKQAERFDPDFARFSSGPPIPIPYQSPSPTLNASAPSFQSSIPPVYPNVVLHHPPTNIAPALSSTPITPTMHNWNTTTHMNMMPVQWDTHPSPQPSFTAYDYQRPGPPYQPNYALPSNIPVAPGLPDHLTNSKSSSHHTQMQSSYNKDFPPLA